MAESRSKNLRTPDETIRLPGITEELVDLGDLTVGRTVQEPGWRWSTHTRPVVGGQWCRARHVGVVLSGRFGVLFQDGAVLEFGPDEVYDIASAHDGYTIGEEPCVVIEWSGLRAFAGFRAGSHGRVLVTLLFTDLVSSTVMATRLGDVAWRELLSRHFEAARAELERFGGREVTTTGDGLLATFNGPAQALRCAAAIRRAASQEGLQVRVGVHVGEVELVGSDVRGVAVHEAARIMAVADQGEILVSEITRTVSLASGLGLRTAEFTRSRGSQASGDCSPLSRILRLCRGDRRNQPRRGRRRSGWLWNREMIRAYGIRLGSSAGPSWVRNGRVNRGQQRARADTERLTKLQVT
jgi:class 3 adenylate cyclase